MRQRCMSKQIKTTASTIRHPLSTSKQSFEVAEIQGIPRISRCRILKSVAKAVKPNIRPPLTNRHKFNGLNGLNVISRPIFKRFFLQTSVEQPLRPGWLVRRVVGLWCPKANKIKTTTRWWWCYVLGWLDSQSADFRVPDGVKMNSATHADFLKRNLVP